MSVWLFPGLSVICASSKCECKRPGLGDAIQGRGGEQGGIPMAHNMQYRQCMQPPVMMEFRGGMSAQRSVMNRGAVQFQSLFILLLHSYNTSDDMKNIGTG